MFNLMLYTKFVNSNTPLVVFSVTYTIYKGPKVDAYESQSFMSATCQYDTFCYQSNFLKWKMIYIMMFSLAHWDNTFMF